MSFWRSPYAVLAGLALAAISQIALAAPPPAAPPSPPAAPSAAASAAPKPAAREITQSLPCSACHTTGAWRTKGTPTGGGFDHAATGFPLTGQHGSVACATCHVPNRSLKRDCNSCHQDAHGGRLSSSCDTCHVAIGWKVTRPLEIHRFTRFPLTGMHVLADCSECHRRASEHQWTGTPTDCFACHERDYRRPDVRPVHQGTATTAPFPRDCSQCHRAIAWVPAFLNPALSASSALSSGLDVAPPNHDLRFPISFGVHRGSTCSDCHASSAVPRDVRCIGCHAHGPARLAQQHRQSVPTQGSACVSCHLGGARR